MSDTDSPLRISICPEEGFGLGVVALDVRQELSLEIEGRGEDSPGDAIPFQLAEPQLHLIEPGTVGRRVVHPHAGVPGQPGLHRRGLVSREVINNDVDLLTPIAAGCLLQEPDELGGVVAWDTLPPHPTRGDLQGGIERERPAPEVLKAVPLALPRSEGQGWLQAIQGLNVALLVKAQHHRMRRRVQVQAQNRRRLGFEVGVGAGDVVAPLMGPEPVASPEAADEALRDPMPLGHNPARPVRERCWRPPLGLGEDAGLCAHRDHFGAARSGGVLQARQPPGEEAAFPVLDHARGQADLPGCPAHGRTAGQQEDRPCAAGQPGFDRARPGHGFQRTTVLRGESQAMGVHVWSLP